MGIVRAGIKAFDRSTRLNSLALSWEHTAECTLALASLW
jgi:hypothetical protein